MTAIVESHTQSASLDAVERVLVQGDLAKLTPDQRLTYYREVCASLGLNPLTQPFEYITLNSKLRLYATKDCAAQLRRIYAISLEIVSREQVGDILMVHARASMPTDRGTARIDEDYGAVNVKGLAGDGLANAMLKAVTKAKRRVTLSICGLGFLDETEVDDVEPDPRGQALARKETSRQERCNGALASSDQPAALSVYERACNAERWLVERGLCQTTELTTWLKRELGRRWPGLLEDWPPEAEQDVRTAIHRFGEERKAAKTAQQKPTATVTAEMLDQLEAELDRTGESWQRVLVRLSLPQDTAGSDLTQEQWQEAMDCLGEMPDRVGGPR